MDKKKYPFIKAVFNRKKKFECVYAGPPVTPGPIEGVYAGPSPDPVEIEDVYAGPEYFERESEEPETVEEAPEETAENTPDDGLRPDPGQFMLVYAGPAYFANNNGPGFIGMNGAQVQPAPPADKSPKHFCENCGMPVPDGARFCGNCGTPLTREV